MTVVTFTHQILHNKRFTCTEGLFSFLNSTETHSPKKGEIVMHIACLRMHEMPELRQKYASRLEAAPFNNVYTLCSLNKLYIKKILLLFLVARIHFLKC